MDDVVGVAVLDRAEELPQALLHLDRVHPVRMPLEVLEDGPLDEFENEVQLALPPEHLKQVDYVVVLQLLREAGRRCGAARRGGARGRVASGVAARSTFRIRTSLSAVLRTCSSSSLSLNFLMATIWPVSLCRALSTMPYVLRAPSRRAHQPAARAIQALAAAGRAQGGAGEGGAGEGAFTPRRSCRASRSSPCWLWGARAGDGAARLRGPAAGHGRLSGWPVGLFSQKLH